MSEIAIKVENLSKMYQIGHGQSGSLRETLSNVWRNTFGGQRSDVEEFWALRDVSFEIKQGDAVGIIGLNGAGKSTLLKLLSKITYPSTGKITMKGRVSSLLEVGTGFHPELTGRENIYLNGTILGMSRREVKSKFDEIVEFSGIEKFLDTPVKRYSSGMYVRLAFAVAAHLEPEILIVDEVLAVGDSEFQKKCLGKMNDVAKGGRTVLFVSHNMGAIQSLCNEGILLVDGKIKAIGNIEHTISSYKDFTSSMISNIRTDKGTYDLTQHSLKKQGQYASMLKVKTYCDQKLSDVFYGGCNFRFDLEFENDKTYEKVLFGFVFRNQNGEALITINTRHLGTKFKAIGGKRFVLKTEIPKFPLFREGIYNIELYIGERNRIQEQIIDAFSIEVEAVDVFKTGQILNSNSNLVYIEQVNLSLEEL